MSEYNLSTDKVDERGFISKQQLLEYVTEQDIFELVFNFKPQELDYVTSPFREDTRPGCWFETDISSGKLRFIDFADNRRISGVKMSNIDCFDSVRIYFKIPNFYQTLKFIKEKLIDGKEICPKITHILPTRINPSKRIAKVRVKIIIQTRNFTQRDGKYWSKYFIKKEELIEDKVFPVQRFKLLDTKSGDHNFKVTDLCYAYTNFLEGRRKLYRPYQKGKKRFVTNCMANDIGGITKLIPSGKQLVITKSYKDYRVLKNQGLNVVWFQNEGMFPSDDILFKLVSRFDKIIIFFDNDEPGILAASKLRTLINSKYDNKAFLTHMPIELLKEDIKDPSDYIKSRGNAMLIKFLKSRKLIH